MTHEHVSSVLGEIVQVSLDFADTNLEQWRSDECEFLRHLFQRLAKPQFYVIPEILDKRAIADDLFSRFGTKIIALLERINDPHQYAKWAGTLSSLGLFQASKKLTNDPLCLAAVVCTLCSDAVRSFGGKPIDDPQAFTSLMRAGSRLLRKFRDHTRVSKAAHSISKISNAKAIIMSVLDEADIDAERRGNELLHSYVGFLRSFPNEAADHDKERRISTLYASLETEFLRRGFSFDAANALARIDAVQIRSPVDFNNIKAVASLLNAARETILRRVGEQGTWNNHVNRRVKAFEAQHGSIEQYVTPARRG